MATVSLTTSSTTLDAGSSDNVSITNTGTVDVVVTRGTQMVTLHPTQSVVIYPEGTAVMAVTSSGSGQVTTSAAAKPLPNAADPTTLAANAAFTGTYLKQTDASSTYATTTNAATKAQLTNPLGTVVTNNCHAMPAPGQWSALGTAGTHRVPFILQVAAADLRLVYTNYVTATSSPWGDTDGSASIPINASIEYSGTIYRATFGGRTTGTMDAGGTLISDPVGLDLAAGSLIFVRTYVNSTAAYPNRANYDNTTFNGAVTTTNGGGFTATTDLTAPGSAAISDALNFLYGPAAVVGKTTSTLPTVVVFGDSISAGQGDTNDMGGYVSTAKAAGGPSRAFATFRPMVNISRSSTRVQDAVSNANHYRRAQFLLPGSWVLCTLGRNDFGNSRTAAQVEADWVTQWQMCKRRGAKGVAQTTITPQTTSTDSWATVGNQTIANSGQDAARTAANDWLRAGAPIDSGTLAPVAIGTSGALVAGSGGHPLDKVYEVADAVESARNSGLWKAAYSGDGLHPKAAGHSAIAGAITVSDFV